MQRLQFQLVVRCLRVYLCALVFQAGLTMGRAWLWGGRLTMGWPWQGELTMMRALDGMFYIPWRGLWVYRSAGGLCVGTWEGSSFGVGAWLWWNHTHSAVRPCGAATSSLNLQSKVPFHGGVWFYLSDLSLKFLQNGTWQKTASGYPACGNIHLPIKLGQIYGSH